MVDAMIGVAIIALSLTLCLASLRLARHSEAVARQTDAAREELSRLLAVTPAIPGNYAGQIKGFQTQVTVSKLPQNQIDLCQLDAQVMQDGTRRTWRLSGMRWCARAS